MVQQAGLSVVGQISEFVRWARENPHEYPVDKREVEDAEASKGEGWGIPMLVKAIVLDEQSSYWSQVRTMDDVANQVLAHILSIWTPPSEAN